MGHSPLRLVVMGDDAWERPATAEECGQMAAILDAAMAAGAWGLSTSFFDEDRRGRKVPSRHADDAEFDVLLDVLARRGRGFVEFVPDLLGTDPEVGMHRLASRCGKRADPADVDRVHAPRGCSTGSTSPAGTASRACRSGPSSRPAASTSASTGTAA